MMSYSWRKAYSELEDYIGTHPEIEIKTTLIRIPKEVHSEYYHLLDRIGAEFMQEKAAELYNEAKTISKNYLEVEREVTEILGLDGITMTDNLRRFLDNPVKQIIKEISAPLLKLLKGEIDAITFEEMVLRNIEAPLRSLNKSGYEKWVTLSLLKLFNPDKLYKVLQRQFSESELMAAGGRSIKMEVPDPLESKTILFRYNPWVIFIEPNFITYSAKAGRYFSLRSEISQSAAANVVDASDEREWYRFEDIKRSMSIQGNGTPVPSSDAMLIYIGKNLKSLALVADLNRICRPDLIVECREQKKWYEKEGLDKIKLHHNSLQPRSGTYIVSREPVTEEIQFELLKGINILTVGFNEAKLEPIIGALMQTENQD